MDFDWVAETDDTMCLAHITDRHLLHRVNQFATEGVCTICTTERLRPDGPIVNLKHLAEVVDEFAVRSFDHDGWVVDGEQLSHAMETEEVVAQLLDGSVGPDALDLVARLTAQLLPGEPIWFERFDMDADASREFEWDDFENSIKHESRLLSPPAGSIPQSTPERNYAFVRSMLVFAEERAGLVRTLRRGTKLYRARIARDAREFERTVRQAPARELGPPPAKRAAAGRMNAQGVPMLYVAEDAATACAEVASHSPYDEPVVGTFILQQPLRILDLTTVLPPRSIFDDRYEEGDERLRSLSFYSERIARPVILDGNHPVDYVASQILTEVFRWWTTPPLDGIAYRSHVHNAGSNIVLFFGNSKWFEAVGEPSSRFDRFQRGLERGTDAPLFVINPKTIRRFRVTRAISVERSGS